MNSPEDYEYVFAYFGTPVELDHAPGPTGGFRALGLNKKIPAIFPVIHIVSYVRYLLAGTMINSTWVLLKDNHLLGVL